ncbi:copper chaperone PCu(A)C [Actinospica robiniae]|uniref:copper chaperone PCu(A)C n=1 Tax=Actinospica robiniae TaxID=304901 RepID=UPI00042759E1|nr:copper chaperone PCu(A)C [Actinospica robiniae]
MSHPRFPLPVRFDARARRGSAAVACTAVAFATACACSSTSSDSGAKAAAAAAAASASASPSPRGSASAGPIRITDAYLPQPASPDVAAVYFLVADTSAQADVLLSATSVPSAQVSLMTESTSGGAESMTPLADGLPIPGNSEVALGPGGYHVMLTDPAVPLKQGGTVRLTLTFRDAGKVQVDVPITSLLSDAQTGSDPASGGSDMTDMPGM